MTLLTIYDSLLNWMENGNWAFQKLSVTAACFSYIYFVEIYKIALSRYALPWWIGPNILWNSQEFPAMGSKGNITTDNIVRNIFYSILNIFYKILNISFLDAVWEL